MRAHRLPWRARLALSLALSLALPSAAWSQDAPKVSLNGRLGRQAALLMIDGQARTVFVGQQAQGVKLLSVDEEQAVVEVNGRRLTLALGAAQASVGELGKGPAGGASKARQIVMSAGPGGHYTSSGSINGHAVQFLVDTGATSVSISQADAERIGLRYREGRRVNTQTANGATPAHVLQLDAVRIGEVTVRNVEAIVLPGQMSFVLLGNSFLNRFQMRRDNDLLTLELRY